MTNSEKLTYFAMGAKIYRKPGEDDVEFIYRIRERLRSCQFTFWGRWQQMGWFEWMLLEHRLYFAAYSPHG